MLRGHLRRRGTSLRASLYQKGASSSSFRRSPLEPGPCRPPRHRTPSRRTTTPSQRPSRLSWPRWADSERCPTSGCSKARPRTSSLSRQQPRTSLRELESLFFTGTGEAECFGVQNTSGVGQVFYTGATTTSLWQAVAAAGVEVATSRHRSPTAIFMAPQRAIYLNGLPGRHRRCSDTASRPGRVPRDGRRGRHQAIHHVRRHGRLRIGRCSADRRRRIGPRRHIRRAHRDSSLPVSPVTTMVMDEGGYAAALTATFRAYWDRRRPRGQVPVVLVVRGRFRLHRPSKETGPAGRKIRRMAARGLIEQGRATLSTRSTQRSPTRTPATTRTPASSTTKTSTRTRKPTRRWQTGVHRLASVQPSQQLSLRQRRLVRPNQRGFYGSTGRSRWHKTAKVLTIGRTSSSTRPHLVAESRKRRHSVSTRIGASRRTGDRSPPMASRRPASTAL